MIRSSMMFACVALTVVAVTVTAARAAENPGATVIVNGQGQVSADPDRATLEMGVSAQAPDAKTAQQQVNEKMAAVIDALKKAGLADAIDALEKVGLADAKIQTSQLSLYPVYDNRDRRDNEEPKIVAYRASNTVRATVQDLKQVGALIDAAIAAGANQINSLQFELTDDQATRKQALANAVKDAQAKATVLAEAMGMTLGEAIEVVEGGVNINPPRPMMMQAHMAMADSTPVQAGQVEITAGVQIRYHLVAGK